MQDILPSLDTGTSYLHISTFWKFLQITSVPSSDVIFLNQNVAVVYSSILPI
jgi:hypothetical protein